jgi:hypothetical protein
MSEPRACRACGRQSDSGPATALSWMCERLPDGGFSWLCAECARSYLPAIESRLADERWLSAVTG